MSASRIAVLAVAFAFAGLVAFGAVGGVTAETVVDECTTLEEDGETYVLEEDLEAADGSFECLAINADGVVFDGQSNSLIDGTDDTTFMRGITVEAGGFSPNTVEIRNVDLEGWASGGIRLRGGQGFSTAPTVENVEIRDVSEFGINIDTAFIGETQAIEDVVIDGVEDGPGIDGDSGTDDTSNEYVDIELSDTGEVVLRADGDGGDSLERVDIAENLTSMEATDVDISVASEVPAAPEGVDRLDTAIEVAERDDGSVEDLRLYYDEQDVPDGDVPAIWHHDGDWDRLDTFQLGDDDGGTFVEVSEDVTEFADWSVFAVLADEPREPTAAVTVDPDAPVTNLTVTFDPTDSVSPNDRIETYRWDFDGDGSIDETTDTQSPVAEHSYEKPGTYEAELEIEDGVGETDTTTVTVEVTEPEEPTASFTLDPEEPVENQEVAFDAADSESPNADIVAYRWDFGDGTTDDSTTAPTTHVFEDPDTYTVELEIEDEAGATNSTTETVTVTADPAPDCSDVVYSEDDGALLVGSPAELQCLGADGADIAEGGSPTMDDEYRLVEAINLSAANVAEWNAGDGFDPIGECAPAGPTECASDPSDRFSGTFDGDGHTIEGLTVSGGETAGLFATLDGAAIERVGLVDVDVVAEGSPEALAGGLAGVALGDAGAQTSTEIFVSGTVASSGYSGGVVAGAAGMEMTDGYSLADVSASGPAGGLVASADDVTIDTAYAAGPVHSEFVQAAGLLEHGESADVTDSYWDVPATGTDFSEGGEGLGELADDAPVENMTGEDAPGNMTGFGFGDEWSTVVEGESLNPTPDSDGYPVVTALDAEAQLEAQGIDFTEADDDFGGGDGSADDPFVIENWDHLDNVRDELDANFTLANDLTETTAGYDDVASETANDGDGFDPIGDSDEEFTGTFDGQGNEIVGLEIDREGEDDVGLFGRIDGASIETIGLVDVDVTGEDNVGSLVGTSQGGDITASYADGDVEGADEVGGLVGSISEGDITGSNATATVTGDDAVGGLVGFNSRFTIPPTSGADIEDSHATGDVIGSGNNTGGLVGFNFEANITDSYATGDVDGEDGAGGLVGGNSDGEITAAYATGDVDGGGAVGGLVGSYFSDLTLEDSYATGDVTGEDNVGGLVGLSEVEITAAYATGNVTGDEDVGGFVGNNTGDVADISDSYWDDEAATVTEDGEEQDGHSDGGEPLQTAEITGANAPDNMSGFEFPDGEGTWHATEDYPVLAWEDTDAYYGVSVTETNAPVTEGETLAVTATVTNWGADGDEQTVELLDFDDDQQDSAEVTLDSGDSTEETLEWDTETSDAGTDEVTVASDDDTASEEVTIEAGVESIDAEAGEAIADGEDGVEFTVTAEDDNEDPVEGITIEVTGSEDVGDLGGIEAGDDAATDENGEATFTATSTDAGEFTVEFEDQQDGNAATATATFVAGDADSVTIDTQPDDTTAGEPIEGVDDDHPEVEVTDGEENPVEGVDVTVDVEGGEFDAGETEVDTDSDGIATFDDLVIEDADESYQLEFSIDDADENVEDNPSSETATTNEFDVDPAAADQITTVDVADSEIAYDEGATTVTVEAEDEFGNLVEDESDALTLDIDGAVYSDSVTNVDISDGDAEVTIDDQDAPSDLDTAVGELTVTAEAADTGNTESGTLTVYPDSITVSFTDSEADADKEAVTDLDLELEDSENTLANDEVDQIDVEYTLIFEPDDYDDEATLAEQTLTGEGVTIEDVTEATDTLTFAATRAGLYAIEGDVQPDVTAATTQNDDTLTVNAVLDDFDISDVTIEQGDPLEIGFSGAEGLAGETFDGLASVTVDVDDLDGIDDPETITLDFDTDGASTDLVLDGSETQSVAPGTYEDIAANADDAPAEDSFTTTVDAVLDDFAVADVTIEQGDVLEVEFSDAEDEAGETFEGEADVTLDVDDLDGIDDPETVTVDFDTDGASTDLVLDGFETQSVAPGTYEDIAANADDAPAVDSFTATVDAVLDDFAVADVTIDQGDGLEVEFSDAEDVAGETFEGEADVTLDVDDLDGVDDDETITVDFDTDGASTDLVLDGFETQSVAPGTYEDIAANADDAPAADTFTVTVEVPIDSMTATIDGDEAPTATTGKTVAVDVTVEDENGDPIEDEEVSIDALDDGGDDVTIDGLSESDTATSDSDGVATFEDVTFTGAIDATIDLTVTAEDDTEDVMTVTVGGFGAGDGSASDPYVITDWYHLDNVRLHLGGAFELGGTLDEETDGYDDVASETANGGDGFEPIGECNEIVACEPDEGASPFSGTFDGNDTEISGLVINSENSENGLFGGAGGATIENVRFHDIDIDIDTADDSPRTGGIVGWLTDSELTRSSVTGEIVSAQDSTTGVGGLVGENWGGTIEQSYANTTVTGGDDHYVGGLVGFNFDDTLFHGKGSISDSYATGDVSGGADDFGTGVGTGGLVGGNSGDISNSYATGDADADENVGGLVGSNSGDITSSYWDDQAATVTEDGEVQDGQGVGDGGGNVAGLTTSEMTGDRAEDTMAFDFESTWDVTEDDDSVEGLEVSYPTLVDNSQEPAPSGTLFAGGYGTASDPYVIEDWYELADIRVKLDANFTLAKDLDEQTTGYGGDGEDGVVLDADGGLADGDGFDPIGGFENEFNGSFDGAGHAIVGLTIDRESENLVGLFGAVETASTLENLSLVDVDVSGDATVGGLAGETGGDVRNVSVSGAVSGTSGFVGALTGLNYEGAVVNVSTSADVQGVDFVGGLVGESQDEIRSATASGDVDGGDNVGGLLGYGVVHSDVTDAVATGTVTATGAGVGGLVGYQGDVTITRSAATGAVEGADDVGGLVGQNSGGTVTESTASGDVAGGGYGTGGLLGWNSDGTVANSSATGSVDGDGSAGGLVGENAGTVTASYATGAVDDDGSADASGGLVGDNSGDVTDSYWDVETTGQDESDGSPAEDGLTTAEMTGANATATMNGFVFPSSEGTWHVVEDDYPALAWEETDPFYGVTITDTTSPIDEGDTLQVTAEVANLAADGDQQAIELFDVTDDQQDTTTVTLDSGETTAETLAWETAVSDAGTGNVTVASENDSDTAEVTVEQEATPELYDLDIAEQGAEATITEGEDEAIAVNVTNVGDQTGAFTVELTIQNGDDVTDEATTAELGADETETVVFEGVTGDLQADEYDVTVTDKDDVTDTGEADNDVVTGTLTVEQEPTPALDDLDIAEQGTEATITEGEDDDITVTVTNVGDQSGQFTVDLTVQNGDTVSDGETTAMLAPDETETITFASVTGDLAPDEYDVTVADEDGTDEVTGSLTVEQEATPELDDLDIAEQGTEATITEADDEDITLNVTNVGDQSGQFTVELTVENGETVTESETTTELDPDESETVTFESVTGDLAPDEYDVTVAGEDGTDEVTGSLTVEQEATPELDDLDIAEQGTGATITEADDEDIAVTVTNVGDQSDSFTVELTVQNGDTITESETTAELDPGETETVVFESVTADLAPDDYDVTVAGEDGTDEVTGTLTVEQEATPELEDLDIAEQGADATITEGDDEDISVNVTNVGDQSGQFTVELTVENGESETTAELDPDESETVTFESVTGDLAPDEYDVTVAGEDGTDEVTGTLTVEQEATPELYDLDIAEQGAEATITEGDDEDITVTVTNVGDQSGQFTVELNIQNGETVTESETTTELGPDETETVAFDSVTADLVPGEYGVTVSDEGGIDEVSGTLTVGQEATPELDGLDIAGQGTDAIILEGDDEDISVNVTNVGDEADSFAVELTVENGDSVTDEVTTADLGPGETETVVFENVTGDLSVLVGESYDVTVAAGDAMATGELVGNPDVTGNGQPATDTTGDGLLDDVIGDRTTSVHDIQALFENLHDDHLQEWSAFFDFAGTDATRVSIFDVQGLFNRL